MSSLPAVACAIPANGQDAPTFGIKIDNAIPLPKVAPGRPRSPVMIALRALEVGQSFIAPILDHDRRKTQIYAGRSGQSLKPKKFSTRIVMEGGKHVVRVWRIA